MITNCQAQNRKCKTLAIGDFYKILQTIKPRKELVSYEKFSGFNYKEFKPLAGNVAEEDFFEVGYNNKKEIKEIIHHQRVPSQISHKMLVYGYNDYVIMLYQVKLRDDPYNFVPAAFILFKEAESNFPKNFMITLLPQFGDGDDVYTPGTLYIEYPIRKFEDISAVMVLDDNLYPKNLIKISDGQIVFDSDIHYLSDNTVDFESASIFFGTKSHPELKISGETCLDQIHFHKVPPDMVLTLHPSVGPVTKTAPLWIFGGAHDYGH
jgi:hypothetical protein